MLTAFLLIQKERGERYERDHDRDRGLLSVIFRNGDRLSLGISKNHYVCLYVCMSQSQDILAKLVLIFLIFILFT